MLLKNYSGQNTCLMRPRSQRPAGQHTHTLLPCLKQLILSSLCRLFCTYKDTHSTVCTYSCTNSDARECCGQLSVVSGRAVPPDDQSENAFGDVAVQGHVHVRDELFYVCPLSNGTCQWRNTAAKLAFFLKSTAENLCTLNSLETLRSTEWTTFCVYMDKTA